MIRGLPCLFHDTISIYLMGGFEFNLMCIACVRTKCVFASLETVEVRKNIYNFKWKYSYFSVFLVISEKKIIKRKDIKK